MKQRWLWELKVTSNSSKIWEGKVAHLILAGPVRVTDEKDEKDEKDERKMRVKDIRGKGCSSSDLGEAVRVTACTVHSEWKNRSKFLTPLKWLFWHSLSLLDLRECILAIFGSPGPLGGVKGGMGGSGGVPGTKNCNFFGSHIWVTNWEILDCMNWKHFIFQVFGQKWPLRRPKMVVFGLKWVNTKVHFSQKHPL